MGLVKASDIRTKSDDELKEQLSVLRKEQFNLRFQKSTGQLAKAARTGHVRKEIAQVLTIQSQRRAGAGVAAKKAAPSTKKAKG